MSKLTDINKHDTTGQESTQEQCNKCNYYDKDTNSCWSESSIYEPITGDNCKHFIDKEVKNEKNQV